MGHPDNEKDETVHVDSGNDLDAETLALITGVDPMKGLSSAEHKARLEKYGPNAIPEKKSNPLLKFLSYFGGAISYLLEIAAVVSGILQDWVDFVILVVVLVVNACIGYFEEARAESALDALKNTLALKCKAFRNGELVEADSAELVPGDVVALRIGDIVPADCRLLGLNPQGEEIDIKLEIDQSALTGESLPCSKVTKTGINTYIGRAANLIASTNEQGHFQKIVNNIGNFLIIMTVVMVAIILFVLIFAQHRTFLDALKEVLIITIAAIPVGLPTVLSVTMAVGAKQLAKKQVIVKRLTAIEELASVSTLCSDKTGTLTLNELTFDEPYLANKGSKADDFVGSGVKYTAEELLLYSFFASEPGAHDAIELAVREAAEKQVSLLKGRPNNSSSIPGYKITGFIPFNPNSKYTEATVHVEATGERFRCIKGAPQVIIRMCGGHDESNDAVTDFARRGLRALGVGRSIDPEMTKFEMVGMISLLDPPRPDSARTIVECGELGIGVKMITGDQLIIAKEVAYRLGMERTILDAHKLIDSSLSEEALTDRIEKCDGFAQVIPEHKYRVVELLQNRGFLVGMTGDGVNDAPALKKANVGIAVAGCTDAARSAADIVLLAPGLNTIVDGVKTSRAIFQRMRSYSIYRITSTIHFLIFFFITILAFGFTLPDRLIILIAVLNDAATLVISVDNAKISRRPDKWRLGQLLTLSFILGICLMCASFAHYFVARDVYHKDQHFIETVMYLQMSSAPHFVIFSTRVPGWFWESVPSMTFIIAVAGTQVFAMFMSIYGVDFFKAVPIGWAWGTAVLAISCLTFVVLDVIKVLVVRYWSFELTAKLAPLPARRRKLVARKERAIVLQRVSENVNKVRHTVRTLNVLMTWMGPKFSPNTKLVHPPMAPSHH
ncbi:H+-exporting ATPase [Synchytrium endobioticum]|uniref:Plasma membrane ATPase n=1 Tax=Synchytrium endobioticum TaxID=286115 RepID=A0A507DI08_9FUNG|nr:H+-exporting ATPase [Synchytrium endobioticum]